MKLNSITNARFKTLTWSDETSDHAQNLPTILKLINLGVNRLGMAYTLLAKSLMS